MRPRLATLLLLTILVCLPSSADDAPPANGGEAGGRLIGTSADALDLLGDVWVRLPFPVASRDDVIAGIETRTSISRADSDLRFDVRDLDYHLEAGWQRRSGAASGLLFSLFAGQRGKQRVDADGGPYVRYLGFGVESGGFRRYGPRAADRRPWEWRLSGGPVVADREVEADFVVRGSARIRAGWGHGLWRRFGARLTLDGLVDGGRFDGDVASGPSLDLRVAGGRQATLFAAYQHSGNPLGIGESALLLGFEYVEGTDGASLPGSAPEIGGVVGTGGGEDRRWNGQLALNVASPPFAGRLHVAFSVDANLVTARDTDDLYYFWRLGVARAGERLLRGVYIYHRSNHQLAAPNDRVTSLNVLEVGIESPGWAGTAAGPRRGARIDGQLHVGYLINSSFGEERRWHARGGLRWVVPGPFPRARPFLAVELESGDIARQRYAVGVALTRRWDLLAEFRNDQQWFSADRNALLLIARYGF